MWVCSLGEGHWDRRETMQMTNRESGRPEILVRGEDRANEASTASQLLPENIHLEGVDAAALPSHSSNRAAAAKRRAYRSEEQTSELQSLMRISYAVCCLKKKTI